MRPLERAIEKGIHAGGGVSFILAFPAFCDGIAMGHDGMRYSLASRILLRILLSAYVTPTVLTD